MKPGIYHGMNIRAYHALDDILSKSGIDDLARSPAIFKALRSEGAPGRKETAAQLHGNLAHCAVLEPMEFCRRYSIHDEMNRNTKEWKAITEKAEAKGKIPIQNDQFKTAMAQASSVSALRGVFRDMLMSDILANGKPEVSAVWQDEATGVMCRCRPDWVHELPDGRVLLLDLKTFSDASAYAFSKQVGRMRYHVQDAFYSMGYEQASFRRVAGFVFVAVEDKYPYAAASYMLGDETRAEGYADARMHIDLFKHCRDTNEWPGYADRTGVIDLPPYMLGNQEIEVAYVE